MEKRSGVGLVRALLLALAAAMIVGALVAQPKPGSSPGQLVITITTPVKDNDTTAIVVKRGSAFSVTLDSNRTTGYSWQLAGGLDRKKVDLVGSKYNEPKASRLVGRGGTEVWNFIAVGVGKTTATLQYARPWEKNVPPVRTERLEITVQ